MKTRRAPEQIQVDGQAFGGTAFELDGTDNQDPILGIIVINPAMDAVTETKITTQNFDAELGQGCFRGGYRADPLGHQQLPRQRLRLPHRQRQPGPRSFHPGAQSLRFPLV